MCTNFKACSFYDFELTFALLNMSERAREREKEREKERDRDRQTEKRNTEREREGGDIERWE